MQEHLFNFFVEFNPKTVSTLRDQISNAVYQQGAEKINIAFSSTGGSLDVGFSLYNFLRSLKRPITTINMGSVESIAMIPYLAGDIRLALSTSKFLIHGMHWTFNAQPVSYQTLKESFASLNSDMERYVSIFDERTGKGQKKLDCKKCLNDDPMVLSSGEAIDYGIVQTIVEPDHITKQSPVPWWVNFQQ